MRRILTNKIILKNNNTFPQINKNIYKILKFINHYG